MKQGIITNNRVRLLLPKGSIGCKGLKMKEGERKKKIYTRFNCISRNFCFKANCYKGR